MFRTRVADELGDVHSSTQPEDQPAPSRADIEARLTVELATVVAGARRRALRDGDRQIDTAHLLHSVMETDPEVRAAFEGGPQVAKVLGYLVQRSIGYGLRWQGSVEDSGAVPVVAVAEPGVTGWSPAAVAAMEGALERAGKDGNRRASGLDLLAALARDRECRAVEVLSRAGVDAELLAGRLGDGTRQSHRW
ncbi:MULTISPECIES: Clp protease N-terminal domain-containing protein [unclassified Streptomyces]|uniref:Clp protease N-terminal domain-containing protein n=1 Tax=unclassified Streptomyces TaxID=2593676 RepID=UPI002E1481F9|nr:peptidase [Streptomyces sp. NBC_01197]WSS47895.1 peptidase [Streptomyces sp. NBC_01180]